MQGWRRERRFQRQSARNSVGVIELTGWQALGRTGDALHRRNVLCGGGAFVFTADGLTTSKLEAPARTEVVCNGAR